LFEFGKYIWLVGKNTGAIGMILSLDVFGEWRYHEDSFIGEQLSVWLIPVPRPKDAIPNSIVKQDI